jgi:hypothetical protein
MKSTCLGLRSEGAGLLGASAVPGRGYSGFARPVKRAGATAAEVDCRHVLTRRRRRERQAAAYLRAVGALFLPAFALPLLLRPYRWARAFGWRPEPETDVGLYFGRCLGAVATAMSVQALRASREPTRHRSLFGTIELAAWLLAAVHARGLIERRQPPVEHLEIAGYSALAVLARRVRPG